MRLPHFFKARSRLGLINIPHGQTSLNIGVEEGADAIITEAFVQQWQNDSVTAYTFPSPEAIVKSDIFEILARESQSFARVILQNLKPSETQVVIGGDHSVTFPSFLAVLHRREDVSNIGYIQFDSHGDMNFSKDSPTNNFHGMYVRPFLDENFDIPEINKLITQRLKPEQVLFIGNLDLDPQEKIFFKSRKIRNITQQDVQENSHNILQEIQTFITSFKHIHITIDIDVFDKSIAPATGIPAEKGLFIEEVEPILHAIASHSDISIDISEVNPQKKGAQKTILLAQRILSILLN